MSSSGSTGRSTWSTRSLRRPSGCCPPISSRKRRVASWSPGAPPGPEMQSIFADYHPPKPLVTGVVAMDHSPTTVMTQVHAPIRRWKACKIAMPVKRTEHLQAIPTAQEGVPTAWKECHLFDIVSRFSIPGSWIGR